MQRVSCRILSISVVLAVLTLLFLITRLGTTKFQVFISSASSNGGVRQTTDDIAFESLRTNQKGGVETVFDSSRGDGDALLESSRTDQDGVFEASWTNQFQAADFYGVMFDAGSTGSRVHVFHFKESPPGLPPVLLSEVFNYTLVPLSKYADNPFEGAASIDGLLNFALGSIPEDYWSSTPVALKATAGLRLLPEEQADALLDAVYAHFKASPLHVETREQSVSIMDGTDEGIFIWITVNFLNGALISPHPVTMGTLDMGGGSTQITFLTQLQNTSSDNSVSESVIPHQFLKHTYQLYTKSYLSLGLKASRLEILKMERAMSASQGSSEQEESTTFSSICLPPYMTGTWEFGGNTYTASSSRVGPEDLYENCLSLTRDFVEEMVHAPEEIRNQTFYALSYFWERAAEFGIVDWKQGGTLIVREYKKAAMTACNNSEKYKDKPFQCMDLVYLSALLSHGYRFRDDVKLVMTNEIQGFRVSWALGATFNLLRQHWEHLRRL